MVDKKIFKVDLVCKKCYTPLYVVDYGVKCPFCGGNTFVDKNRIPNLLIGIYRGKIKKPKSLKSNKFMNCIYKDVRKKQRKEKKND